jgi:metallo-beta-lactamase family protein
MNSPGRWRRGLGCPAFAPYSGGSFDLASDTILTEGRPIPVKAKKPAMKKADAAFERLVAAGKRLIEVIYKNEGLAK